MSAAQRLSGAATDVEAFAERVLARPLWRHQAELLRSPARYRVVAAGRQAGKSATLAVAALHCAATKRNALVLVISAGEVAARRLLGDIADVATSSPLLAGSVVDESKGALILSNGSRIVSVPASQRQVRGWSIDLLILDEAGFIDDALWRAAEPAIVARPGSRVIMASSPWGGPEAFFRALWRRGMDRPDEHVESWHWPSSISTLVDAALLESIREREAPDYFRREFLAEWPDEYGAYFSEPEIMRAVVDYELTDPASISPSTRWQWPVAGGLDWGQAVDANALTLVSLVDSRDTGDLRWRVFVALTEAHYRMGYAQFIDRVIEVTGRFRTRVIASEVNGVGQFPTDELEDRLRRTRSGTAVSSVWTDVRRKQSGFGKIKTLMQSDRLALPRHPELLKQLRSLEFEQLGSGSMRIAVPERAGHDDQVMSLLQAVSAIETRAARDGVDDPHHRGPDELVETSDGVTFPRHPRPADEGGWISLPSGQESGDGW